MRGFAKFLILGQFFKGRLIRQIGLYASIYVILGDTLSVDQANCRTFLVDYIDSSLYLVDYIDES